jgi:hypothetical protein
VRFEHHEVRSGVVTRTKERMAWDTTGATLKQEGRLHLETY